MVEKRNRKEDVERHPGSNGNPTPLAGIPVKEGLEHLCAVCSRSDVHSNRRVANIRDEIHNNNVLKGADPAELYAALQSSASEVYANITGINRYDDDWETEEIDLLSDHLDVE